MANHTEGGGMKILGHEVDVIYDDKWNLKRSTVGSYCANMLQITIDPTYPETRQEEGFLHEIFEAIRFHTDSGDTVSHALMSTMSEVMYQIIKDNPGVFTIKLPRKEEL
jgi:hypothetical protein